MVTNTNVSPFLGVSLTLLFTFSTLYTLVYYYDMGASTSLHGDSPGDSDGSSFSGFDILFNSISWLSPFGFIKLLIQSVMISTPDFYMIIDLLILRPIGWFVFLVQGNYLLSLIPAVGKGE